MLFKDVLGLTHLKKHLTTSANAGRIPHAQLFVGAEGSGTLTLAIAYAQYILCKNNNGENINVNQICNAKCESLTHPDLHFAFPVSISENVKKDAISDNYIKEWRQFIKAENYCNLFDWYRHIGIEKKQGLIGVHEAKNILKKLSLKSYEGGYKVLIVWMAEKMNTEASNKLLKLIEEPPKNTIFILVVEDETQIIDTIKSRRQILHIPPMPESVLAKGLIIRSLPEKDAYRLAHEANGNFKKALDLMNNDSEDLVFEKWFVKWVRSAFKAKGNKTAIHELIKWSEEIAKSGREIQKKFLNYCVSIMRQAMLLNYTADELVFTKINHEGFDLEKFAPFVHENNILDITKELEKAIFHVERNGNAKIIFTDLSIKLTRLLHAKIN